MRKMTHNISNQNDTQDITDVLPGDRHAAIKEGNTKYFTGKPCRQGHVVYRYTKSGMCAQCSSVRAKKKWGEGWRQNVVGRDEVNKRWNASSKGQEAKRRWKRKNPKRAWAVCATGSAKMRAKLKDIPFDLTTDYVESITPDTCPVFGTPFSFIGGKCMTESSASIDRIDTRFGYVRGNVAVISFKANAIKNRYSSHDIRKVADWLGNLGY
jgi:hypothetical protein